MSGSLDFYGVDGVMDEMKNILRDKLVYTTGSPVFLTLLFFLMEEMVRPT